jgi:transposase InsO family protein
MSTWRAGCSGSCTSGSEGGPQKPTRRKLSRALRSDPYTEHPTAEGKVYCAVVLDVFSRRVVGWSIDSSQNAALVTDALGMAIVQRRPTDGTVIHSDQGTLPWSPEHSVQPICRCAKPTCTSGFKGASRLEPRPSPFRAVMLYRGQ